MGRRSKDGPAKIVVLRCDECGHPIGNRGYLAVDRVLAMERRAGVVRSVETYTALAVLDREIFWRIVHTGCDVEPRTTDYRIPSGRFTTTGDLLEATADLMRRHPWVIETNWPGLIGRVLADTRRLADRSQPAKTVDRPNGGPDAEDESPETEGQEND